MHIGFATDHGGYILKEPILKALRDSGHEVEDFGAHQLDPGDDYPDFHPSGTGGRTGESGARQRHLWQRCRCRFAANKVTGVRSALIHESFSAHQGVEDDDMNLLCLGGRVVGSALAWEIIQTYLAAHYTRNERFERRLAKVAAIECKEQIK